MTLIGFGAKEHVGEGFMDTVLEHASDVQPSVTETRTVLYGPADVGLQLMVPVDGSDA